MGENVSFVAGLRSASRPRTVDEGVKNELPVLLDQVVDVSEDAAHDGCEYMWCCRGWEETAVGEKLSRECGSPERSAKSREQRADERSGVEGLLVGLAARVGGSSQQLLVNRGLQVDVVASKQEEEWDAVVMMLRVRHGRADEK
jgi:hypothetical protein